MMGSEEKARNLNVILDTVRSDSQGLSCKNPENKDVPVPVEPEAYPLQERREFFFRKHVV